MQHWTCQICGTENRLDFGVCVKCHYIRGATKESAAQGRLARDQGTVQRVGLRTVMVRVALRLLVGAVLFLVLGVIGMFSAFGGGPKAGASWFAFAWLSAVVAIAWALAGLIRGDGGSKDER